MVIGMLQVVEEAAVSRGCYQVNALHVIMSCLAIIGCHGQCAKAGITYITDSRADTHIQVTRKW